MKNGSITTVLTPNTETTHWMKTVSVSVSLDTDDIGFGNGQITIYGCKDVIMVVDKLDKLIEELQQARKELFFSI